MPVLDGAGVTLAGRTRIRHMVKEGVHAELLNLRRGLTAGQEAMQIRN